MAACFGQIAVVFCPKCGEGDSGPGNTVPVQGSCCTPGTSRGFYYYADLALVAFVKTKKKNNLPLSPELGLKAISSHRENSLYAETRKSKNSTRKRNFNSKQTADLSSDTKKRTFKTRATTPLALYGAFDFIATLISTTSWQAMPFWRGTSQR
jgi:hypothetical protein